MGKLKPNYEELFDIANRLMTTPELAKFCNVGVRTVERWVQLRRIPYMKLAGGSVRFDKAEVAEWLKRTRIAPWLFQQK